MIDKYKSFEVSGVCRADLLDDDERNEKEVMALTDEEMINIAEEMNEMYCNNGYHEDLDTAYNKIKNNK